MAYKILWVDDHIEELRSHAMYLGEKGYDIEGVTNGMDALATLRENNFDAILLDEMMPGMGGLETLEGIRKIDPNIPVIMVTKSEAEDLMTRAIGKRIDDYLVKPVSPIQVLSALKRQVEARKLAGEEVTRNYMSNFMAVTDRIAMARTPGDWEDIYSDLVTWGMDLFQYSDHGLLETQGEQLSAANLAFGKYVRENYKSWIHAEPGSGDEEAPLFSPRVFEKLIEPEIQRSRQVFWITIDCMRLDQVRMIEPLLEPYFHIDRKHYWSMLPSATPYARNALFAGLYPLDIAKGYPQWWLDGNHEGSRNAYEGELLNELLNRVGSAASGSCKYFKIADERDIDPLHRNLGSMGDTRLVAAVYNFLDIMAHGRSQNRILKELAPDEAAFRTLMRTWFEHVILTTDHGSMMCRRSMKIRGNRDTSSNVRYKFGDNLGTDDERILLMKNPEDFRLPAHSSIENYAVTSENFYLVYPTNFHEYERLYRDSFQHGGISMEEMICPFVVMRPR